MLNWTPKRKVRGCGALFLEVDRFDTFYGFSKFHILIGFRSNVSIRGRWHSESIPAIHAQVLLNGAVRTFFPMKHLHCKSAVSVSIC